MNTKTNLILKVMLILSWIILIGLCIKTGAILLTYLISTGKAEGARNLFMGLNLFDLREYSFWYYSSTVSLIIAMQAIKAYTAFLVVKLLMKIKLVNPFTIEVSRLLEKISYFIFSTWIIVLIFNAQIKWLAKSLGDMDQHVISDNFILLAGVVYIFSQIFKRGVELQSENELTV